MDKEDIFLVRQAKKNREAYEALYKKYAQRVFNYFWYRVGYQKDVAEDLLQETFMRAYQNLPSFYLRSYSYYSYLLKIANNLLINYFRKTKPVLLDSVDNFPTETTQDEEFSRAKDAELLWRAIQQLPQPEKNILLLRYQDNLSIKDIARIVGKSQNAVKLILSRTRKKLAKHPYLKEMASFAGHQKKYTKPRFLKKKP